MVEALANYPYFNIYPDNGQAELRGMLAGYTGAGAERIVASGGSNQLIDLIVRLFVGPGDEVITPSFTFIATAIYLFAVDLASLQVGYRVLAFLFLAAISIAASVYYTKRLRKKNES